MHTNNTVSKDAEALVILLEKQYKNPAVREFVLNAALKLCRERRYFDRGPGLEKQEWREVLREGFTQYLVSNWGFVRHKNKSTPLRPAFGHDYARAPMKAPLRKSGGSQQMIHELVWESFVLGRTLESLESYGIKKGYEAINHKDGDKWNPALINLEFTNQSGNMEDAYRQGLRKPRKKL